jgi:hypothetical protein
VMRLLGGRRLAGAYQRSLQRLEAVVVGSRV